MTHKPLAGLADAASKDAVSAGNSLTTPRALFDAYDQACGGFRLDAAASHENALVSHYCTVDGEWNRIEPPAIGGIISDRDGIAIAKDWRKEDGPVFCNPPYGRGLMAPFIEAWCEAARLRGVPIALLVPVRTDQPWFHDHVQFLVRVGGAVDFLRGRVKYGGLATGAPFPSMIVRYGFSRPEGL